MQDSNGDADIENRLMDTGMGAVGGGKKKRAGETEGVAWKHTH